MKDEKGKLEEPKKGNVYLVNEGQKKDEGKIRSHPDPQQQLKHRRSQGDQKDDDPLSIGESDGGAG